MRCFKSVPALECLLSTAVLTASLLPIQAIAQTARLHECDGAGHKYWISEKVTKTDKSVSANTSVTAYEGEDISVTESRCVANLYETIRNLRSGAIEEVRVAADAAEARCNERAGLGVVGSEAAQQMLINSYPRRTNFCLRPIPSRPGFPENRNACPNGYPLLLDPADIMILEEENPLRSQCLGAMARCSTPTIDVEFDLLNIDYRYWPPTRKVTCSYKGQVTITAESRGLFCYRASPDCINNE